MLAAMKQMALVGGAHGIGRELLLRWLSEGHRVWVATREPEALRSLGCECQYFDATQPVDLVWPERLDAMVYCPGTITLKPFSRCTTEDFLRDFQINVLGAVATLQSALPALKQSPSAGVVLFSTIAVAQGMAFHASVAAAKGAVEGLARSLAAEWAPRIRVNVVAPSLTRTHLAEPLLNTEAKAQAAAQRHPLQQVGNPADVAQLVDFLLSDAARFITGQVLRPDGGLSSLRLF